MGLREDSRIKMQLIGQVVPTETLLMAGILDRLTLLLWRQTEDGQKGKNRPQLVVDSLTTPQEDEKQQIIFNSGEEFEEARKEIIKNLPNGGE